ncbi:MAG: hypothetical protein ACJ8DI_17000 [Ktedonobacteraceae bacterium]
MSQQYRICRNCAAPIASDQAYCLRCGAQSIEPIVQQSGKFETFPPEQAAAPGPVVPYAVQQPVVPPYPPQQGQGYAPPSAPSPYYPATYAQQTPLSPGPEQVGSSPQSPPPRPTISPGLFIILAVVALLLLVGIGSLFYNLSQHNSSKPGPTPTPGITPNAAPTRETTPIPTRTPGITPTPTAFQAPTTGITVNQHFIYTASSISFAKTGTNT